MATVPLTPQLREEISRNACEVARKVAEIRFDLAEVDRISSANLTPRDREIIGLPSPVETNLLQADPFFAQLARVCNEGLRPEQINSFATGSSIAEVKAAITSTLQQTGDNFNSRLSNIFNQTLFAEGSYLRSEVNRGRLATLLQEASEGIEEIIPKLDNIFVYANLLRDELNSQAAQVVGTEAGNQAGNSLGTPAAQPTQEEKPPAPQWGVKVSIPLSVQPSDPLLRADELASTRDFYLSLLPAMGSTLSLQGSRDVPNSMPGLQFRVVPNIGKFRVPGFQSVHQHLGMDAVQVTMVGCFLGNDGEVLTNINPEDYWDNSPLPSIGPNQSRLQSTIKQLDSYRSFQEFYKFAVLSGRELEVEINTAKNTGALAELSENQLKSLLRTPTGNPKFKCVVRNMEVFYAKADRTWYTIQMEVTDLGLASKTPIDLTNKISEGIQEAQAESEQLASEAEITEIANLLKDQYHHEKFVTSDGCTVYVFRQDSIAPGQAIKQCLVNGQSEFSNLSPSELEAERNKRIGEDTSGDWLALIGTGLGCFVSLPKAATVVGGVGAVLSCYNYTQVRPRERTLQEGAIDGALGAAPAILPFLGSVGGSLGSTGVGRFLLSRTGINFLSRSLSGIGEAASRFPGIRQAAQALGNTTSFVTTQFNRANTLGGRIGNQTFLNSAVNGGSRQVTHVLNRLRGLPSTPTTPTPITDPQRLLPSAGQTLSPANRPPLQPAQPSTPPPQNPAVPRVRRTNPNRPTPPPPPNNAATDFWENRGTIITPPPGSNTGVSVPVTGANGQTQLLLPGAPVPPTPPLLPAASTSPIRTPAGTFTPLPGGTNLLTTPAPVLRSVPLPRFETVPNF